LYLCGAIQQQIVYHIFNFKTMFGTSNSGSFEAKMQSAFIRTIQPPVAAGEVQGKSSDVTGLVKTTALGLPNAGGTALADRAYKSRHSLIIDATTTNPTVVGTTNFVMWDARNIALILLDKGSAIKDNTLVRSASYNPSLGNQSINDYELMIQDLFRLNLRVLGFTTKIIMPQHAVNSPIIAKSMIVGNYQTGEMKNSNRVSLHGDSTNPMVVRENVAEYTLPTEAQLVTCNTYWAIPITNGSFTEIEIFIGETTPSGVLV
jgi:hypothetical protein